MKIIDAHNIVRQYTLGGTVFKALDGVSLTINQGEFVSIVGKSGSGKSTLMHILGLLDRASSGQLSFAGQNVYELDDTHLAKLRSNEIGFVFQSFNLLARTGALDNVMLPSVYTSKKYHVKDRALAILAKVELLDKLGNTPAQLSGGQQQRVAIARALINDPAVILADEPTGNLDSKSGEEVMQLLKGLHSEGKTVIIVTHDDDVARNAKRIVRITDGKIVADQLV
jgi:putative ABC transport system ATP-binding protein